MIISATDYVDFFVQKITQTLKTVLFSNPPDALLFYSFHRLLALLALGRASSTYTALATTQPTMSQRDQPQGLGLSINQPSVPEIKIMSTPPTPTSTRSRRFVNHDTGFPEPFNGSK
jgi:hypothetical protein